MTMEFGLCFILRSFGCVHCPRYN